MFREPWFSIIEVHEPSGRSMADIAAEVAAEHGVEVSDLRGTSRRHKITSVRHDAFLRICRERPELSSAQIARYFHREGSTLRHVIRNAGDDGIPRRQKTTRIWTDAERERIASLLRCGVTKREIAAMFGIVPNAARQRIERDEALKGLAA
jgi:hypothetical protein